MSDAAHALTLQFLAWVAESPRSYGEAMEAWRSTCPRLSIWEDAILDGLVRVEGNGAKNQSRVVLTPRGRTLLTASGGAGPAPATAKPRPADAAKAVPAHSARPARAPVPSN